LIRELNKKKFTNSFSYLGNDNHTFVTIKSKGIPKGLIKEKMFEQMIRNEPTPEVHFESFSKNGIKNNTTPFDIHTIPLKRSLSTQSWEGRDFINDEYMSSYPKGYL